MIGIVSRFADQKGFDLIAQIAGELVKENVSIVALGTGEPKYENFFREMAGKYPKQFGVKIAYDNTLAHKIEAGADMFLMPSRYEPCGLNQIYSLKYGTVPIVRATGGLDDTIENYDPASGRGTGFKFVPVRTGRAPRVHSQGARNIQSSAGVAKAPDQRDGQGFLLACLGGRVRQAVRRSQKSSKLSSPIFIQST